MGRTEVVKAAEVRPVSLVQWERLCKDFGPIPPYIRKVCFCSRMADISHFLFAMSNTIIGRIGKEKKDKLEAFIGAITATLGLKEEAVFSAGVETWFREILELSPVIKVISGREIDEVRMSEYWQFKKDGSCQRLPCPFIFSFADGQSERLIKESGNEGVHYLGDWLTEDTQCIVRAWLAATHLKEGGDIVLSISLTFFRPPKKGTWLNPA